MSAYSPTFISRPSPSRREGSSGISNLISSPLVIAVDTSYIVLSYLKVESSLTVNGNLGVL